MSADPNRQSTEQPSEQELRAALEEQMRRMTVEDVLVQSAVSLINLAGMRLGLGPDREGERDLGQVRDAIDAVRGLMPVLERRAVAELRALRDALAQLQVEYARLAQTDAGAAPEQGGAEPAPPGAGQPEEHSGTARPGPAQSSGRLWVPGQ